MNPEPILAMYEAGIHPGCDANPSHGTMHTYTHFTHTFTPKGSFHYVFGRKSTRTQGENAKRHTGSDPELRSEPGHPGAVLPQQIFKHEI